MSNLNFTLSLFFLFFFLITLIFIIHKIKKQKKNNSLDIDELEEERLNNLKNTPTTKEEVIEKPIEWIDLAVDKIDKLNNINDLINLKNKKTFIITEEELLSEKNDNGGSGKILVVDDALVIRKKITLLLEKNDYAYIAQKDGQYAIHYLEYLLNNNIELPDIIITDLEMPNLDGLELINWIRNIDALKHIPIIIVSSHMNLQKLFTEQKVQGFLPKPFNDADLINQIDYLLKF